MPGKPMIPLNIDMVRVGVARLESGIADNDPPQCTVTEIFYAMLGEADLEAYAWSSKRPISGDSCRKLAAAKTSTNTGSTASGV
jgi:hypothetical protein